MATWDYAQLAHLAKEFGGPKALINSIRASGVSAGRVQGSIIGSIATLVVGGIGLYVYGGHRKKVALAEQSAAVLKANIEACGETYPIAVFADNAEGVQQSKQDEGLEPGGENENGGEG